MNLLSAPNRREKRKLPAALRGMRRTMYAGTALIFLSGSLLPSSAAAAFNTESSGWRILLSKLNSQNRFVHRSGIRLMAIKPGKVSVITYRTASGEIKSIQLPRIITLARMGFIHPHSASEIVYLKDGSYLSGQRIISHGNNFRIKTRLGTILVPLVDSTGVGTERRGLIRRRAAAHDRLFLDGGGRLKGTFLACSADGIEMRTRLGTQSTPWSRVKRLVLGGLPTRAGGSQTAHIELLNGSMLNVSDVQLANRRFTLHTAAGLTLHIPQSMVGEINTCHGDVTWLAAVHPEIYRQTPLFGTSLPMGFNRNAIGGHLRVDGIIYRHGIGLHAPCTITYRLGGAYRYLVFAAQMDDSAGRIGRGDVSIRIDGKPVYDSGILEAGKPVLFVKLPLHDAVSVMMVAHSVSLPATRCRIDLLDAALIRR